MYLAFMEHGGERLITVGDAIASYLQRPEPFTKGYCTYSQKELLFHLGILKPNAIEREELDEHKTLYSDRGAWVTSRKRYISSLSSNRGAFGVAL
jgi:hypothetical protein